MSDGETRSEAEQRMRMEECIRMAEDEYDQIYEPRTHRNPAGHFSDAEDLYCEAIGLARQLGESRTAEEIEKRLEHIKAVYRGQIAGGEGYAATPYSHVSDLEMEELAGIEDNAERVVESCRTMTNFDFGFDDRSVKWLDGWVNRMRAHWTAKADCERMGWGLGSYLGEAVIRACGGKWAHDEDGWHVRFDGENRAYPMSKTLRHIANGPEDSVYAFYRAVIALRKEKLGIKL